MVDDSRRDFEKQLTALVDKFAKHHADYLRAEYSETEVRAEFIDQFFAALGWDVYNNAGRSPKTREVFREAGETHGRVDYVFRIESRDVFYVEAKAPHVALDRTDVVLQAKRYAWNSPNVFLAAVTDFQEFRLYDATGKPERKHPHAGLIFAYRYSDYLKPKALDDLWQLSREAVGTGSIDRLLKQSPIATRNRVPVDQAFLEDLSGWREQLAKAVFKTHPALSPADLNNIVQVFLDRLIFIRICEDRRILDPYQLSNIVAHWEYSGKRVSIAADLIGLFREINDRLNGEIFKPHRCEKMDWDSNAPLVAEIIKNLYLPASPYLFDKIPVELLGSIYERYLGKTIRVTETRAIVEDKPEVRKAGGVYYTPKYIVDYIVAQTVGKLIEGKTPKQIEKLKILDPACGSGSFLLGAYQALLDYHTRWHAARTHSHGGGGRDGGQARLFRESSAEYGEFKLSLEQKAQILRNNIFGVDIDAQAVEITMMSLYIKMLEDERGFVSGRAVLPLLRDNIKCGNSLIGYDIGELDEGERARINPFDWNSQSEGFGAIMAQGGFDAVIGNPPYVKLHNIEKKSLAYYFGRYETAEKKCDLYAFFIERVLGSLRKGGILGYITSNTWLNLDSFTNLRRIICKDNTLVKIATLENPFAQVTVAPVIFFVRMGSESGYSFQVEHLDITSQSVTGHRSISASTLLPPAYIFDLTVTSESKSLLRRIQKTSILLARIADLQYGIMTADNKKFVTARRQSQYHKPLLSGEDVERYEIKWSGGRYVDYRPEEMKKKKTARPGEPERFEQDEKIVFQRYSSTRLIAVLDTEQFYTLGTTIICHSTSNYSNRYILGLINSRLLSWWYGRSYTSPTNYIREFEQLPIRAINFDDPADKSRHANMVALVDRMLELHRQKQATRSDVARERIEREIHVTDEQIDALVYELYGLTEDEIKIVEVR
jgi:hypothetical protein